MTDTATATAPAALTDPGTVTATPPTAPGDAATPPPAANPNTLPPVRPDYSAFPQAAQDELSKLREEVKTTRSEAAAWRQKLREAEPAVKQVKELEDAQKTETQRLQEQVAAMQAERDAAAANALKYETAAKHSISGDYLDLLGSGTPEELDARAARISELIQAKNTVDAAAATPPAAGSGRPIAQLRPGATPNPTTHSDEDALYAQLYGSR